MKILGIIPARYASSRFPGKYLVVAILAIVFCFGCVSMTSDWKVLDLGSFKISIPKDWNYKQEQGEDSFVGEITTTKSSLHFDYSSMGYANNLILTVDEYLKNGEWLIDCPFCKPGITYTANFNIKAEKARQMKQKGITDSTLVKVEADPDYETKTFINLLGNKQKNIPLPIILQI
jgi:hypothetical protein